MMDKVGRPGDKGIGSRKLDGVFPKAPHTSVPVPTPGPWSWPDPIRNLTPVGAN